MIKEWGRGISVTSRSAIHFFLAPALAADLVVVPAATLGVTALMTPTATVCLMSRTAKRPSGGKSEKASTHMGLEGISSTMPASPDLMNLAETFLTLKPTLSPGTASGRDSWCISTDLTSVVSMLGAKVTTIPGLMIPVSTLPTGTVPIPPIL